MIERSIELLAEKFNIGREQKLAANRKVVKEFLNERLLKIDVSTEPEKHNFIVELLNSLLKHQPESMASDGKSTPTKS